MFAPSYFGSRAPSVLGSFGVILSVLVLPACSEDGGIVDESTGTQIPHRVDFATPLSESDFAQLLTSSQVRPDEIYFQTGTIVGGYTASGTGSVVEALGSLQRRHLQFLAEAQSLAEEEISSAKDAVEGRMARDLAAEFEKAAEVARERGLAITGFEARISPAEISELSRRTPVTARDLRSGTRCTLMLLA